ncbi:uncharacterized protein BJ171DRAFT_580243 [Polychytrium aggregatum]|uniref:uncharacterized protein n=1 Tax=Polychytrium aggregatum TaxID=110093 RepID=UPI0022FDDC4E|nr:uncharacterized protein BJ171DRAFT_580243 [Polychytrium aggregatum]KAI9206166.1 hypothetical protein BJ171DRAFT_580243 [Polychytrium aggregatum]
MLLELDIPARVEISADVPEELPSLTKLTISSRRISGLPKGCRVVFNDLLEYTFGRFSSLLGVELPNVYVIPPGQYAPTPLSRRSDPSLPLSSSDDVGLEIVFESGQPLDSSGAASVLEHTASVRGIENADRHPRTTSLAELQQEFGDQSQLGLEIEFEPPEFKPSFLADPLPVSLPVPQNDVMPLPPAAAKHLNAIDDAPESCSQDTVNNALSELYGEIDAIELRLSNLRRRIRAIEGTLDHAQRAL